MWIYLFLLILVGCVGTEQEFKQLFLRICGEELKSHAPLDCAGEAFLPHLLQSKEELVTMNFDILASYSGYYTPDQLRAKSQAGDSLWGLALKAGAEKIYLNLLTVPGLTIDPLETSRIFYQHAPRMFVNYQNFTNLKINPSMAFYLAGNGQNPHSLIPLSTTSKDILLRHLHEETSLFQIAHLFYFTNALRDADLVRDLEPYLHLSLPFPLEPDLTVSLGALVARKWLFQLRAEFFVENNSFFDPLALAVYEGLNVDAYLPFTKRSQALTVAYALLDDSQLIKIRHFTFQKLSLLGPHPAFQAILKTKSSDVKDQYYRGIRIEKRSYKSLRSMILAIKAGHHDEEIMRFFWGELNEFIKNHGIYPSFNRFIGHELQPIQDILYAYGYDLQKLIPRYKKHIKKRDYFNLGSL